MKFNVGPGVLTLDTGNWSDGYADGAYRVKKDADDQSADGIDFELFKLGSIFTGGKAINYVDDLTSGNGEKAVGGFASYAFDVTDGVNLNVTVGGVESNGFDKSIRTRMAKQRQLQRGTLPLHPAFRSESKTSSTQNLSTSSIMRSTNPLPTPSRCT